VLYGPSATKPSLTLPELVTCSTTTLPPLYHFQLLDKQVLDTCVLAGPIKNKDMMAVAARDMRGLTPAGGGGPGAGEALGAAARQARSAAWAAGAALCVCTQTKATPFLTLLQVSV
jgi:hypothetical protein